MWYKQQLKRVRQARKLVKHQQDQLLILELEGLVAVQLHTLSSTLALPISRHVASQLKAEAKQLTHDQRESQVLRAADKALLKAAKKQSPR
jgi:hypothetical protein